MSFIQRIIAVITAVEFFELKGVGGIEIEYDDLIVLLVQYQLASLEIVCDAVSVDIDGRIGREIHGIDLKLVRSRTAGSKGCGMLNQFIRNRCRIMKHRINDVVFQFFFRRRNDKHEIARIPEAALIPVADIQKHISAVAGSKEDHLSFCVNFTTADNKSASCLKQVCFDHIVMADIMIYRKVGLDVI